MLPVYLIGLGVIVYLSPYGPLTYPVIRLWWDIAVTAVFSLGIYYWALAIALPTEQSRRSSCRRRRPSRRSRPDPAAPKGAGTTTAARSGDRAAVAASLNAVDQA